jgi:hypothetical protein
MAEPAASGIQIGVAVASGVAGVVVEWVGFSPPMLALALAASGLGMLHARQMPRAAAVGTWLCSAICAASLGSGAAELAGWLMDRAIPPSIVGVAVVLSGIAMHPFIGWVGSRFDRMADAAVTRAGLDVQEPKQ